MKSLSACLSDTTIEQLRRDIRAGIFPGVNFEQAMQFLLTNGILPASGLPATSFLKLEDWARTLLAANDRLTYTATELKNKSGEILEKVLQGKVVQLVKHGRPIAEIRKLKEN